MDDFKPLESPRDLIERSWQRCQERGLFPGQANNDAVAPRSELADRLEANARLIAYAQPVIEHLHQQIARSSSMVLLADAGGTILRAVGDPGFVDRAARISLAPGAVWSEECMGTNAVGTALHEKGSVAVFGQQHYLERNQFLTCIATPIVAPSGGILGILDISSDARVTPTHAQALLQSTVEMIENRLIEAAADGVLVLHFHPVVEMLGTPIEGLLVFGESGTLLSGNRRAHALLGLGADKGAGSSFGQYFLASWHSVLDHALRRGEQILRLRCGSGRELAALVRLRTAPRKRTPSLAGNVRNSAAGAPPAGFSALGQGDARLADAVRRARRIALHDIPLLIQGETGTGKEVFARAFHGESRRHEGPFVAINCAAIPASLIEAELFGYAAGAYTGGRAGGARGKLREAHGGVLFLDEIGDMPLALQAVLLRVLETRRVSPLGGGAEEAVDIGLVCASHRPLRELTESGAFRSDLFFRLSGMTVSLPALRERSDFVALAKQILDEESLRGLRLATEALRVLQKHLWPGNLRQLRNVLRLAIALMGEDESTLTLEHLPPEILDETNGQPSSPGQAAGQGGLRAAEFRLVQQSVTRHAGNISAAARELGITRTTLYRKLRQE